MRSPVELTLLGTGTSHGIPLIGCECKVCTSADPRDNRLRTAAFIQVGDTGISIDIGPDFRLQMLRYHLSDVHAILLTHEHNDHISGLDDIRPINYKYNRDIPVYGGEHTLNEIRKRFYYAFDESFVYIGKPKVHAIPIDHNAFNIGSVSIQPIPVLHGELLVYGFRVHDVAYITDAKTISDESKALLQNLDILILNALRTKDHPTHLTLEEAIALYRELNPHRCYLVHLSHEMGLHEEIERMLPSGLHVGYDGLRLKSV